ncbi:MAG: phosphatidylserine decarboxylase family protein [Saprospiraceae bacterium]|nr:phosphatidylserine decarboxylase family protein [Saprospiraceae bacterium]
MNIHKEGKTWVAGGLVVYLVLILIFYKLGSIWFWPWAIVFGVFFWLILNFFRNPKREIPEYDDRLVYAPADGKIVVIEEIEESEFFQTPRKMVSIFMNPLNVHVNRYPFSGKVVYTKYHPGLYLVAWHPKSSTDNERNTVVIERTDGTLVLLRQIAGALARRICSYAQAGNACKQGEDFGFIKFGSRVDLFLPLNAEIRVEMGQKVEGNKDVIAFIP